MASVGAGGQPGRFAALQVGGQLAGALFLQLLRKAGAERCRQLKDAALGQRPARTIDHMAHRHIAPEPQQGL